MKVGVIAGGTSGIGAAIARRLAGPGQRLVLGYLENGTRAGALAAELRGRGSEVRCVEGHLAETTTVDRMRAAVDEWGGVCHQLVHSVALTSFKPLATVKPNQWNLIIAVSARTLLDLVAALADPLSRGRGAVVAISSSGSARHVPCYGALGPAKAALEGVVRQLAVDFAPKGIRLNAIRAGLVESAVLARFPPGMREAVVGRTPMGRLGAPDEIAGVAEFLLGEQSSWVVGQTIEVDGGLSIT